MKLPVVLGFVASVWWVSNTAHASTINYQFEGTVTALGKTSLGVNIGDQIPISITVTDPGTGGPNYYGVAGAPDELIPSATFGGINYTSTLQSIQIVPASSIRFFATVPRSNYGFELDLTGARPGVVATGALPATLNPADFTGGTFFAERSFYDESYYSGTINGLRSIPEPASWLLFAPGLLAICLGGARSVFRDKM